MSQKERSEKSRLIELFLLMKVPRVLAFLIMTFLVPLQNTSTSNMWWLLGPMGVISLFVIALPFYWKGGLSYKEVSKRVFRRPDALTMALATFPIIFWVTALVLTQKSPEHPYTLHLPSFLFEKSQFLPQILVLSLLGGLSSLVGILIFANAEQYSTRMKFMCLLFGFDIAYRLVQYGWNYYTLHGDLQNVIARFISPVFDITLSIGLFAVVTGLMQRGRYSVQAIAVFMTTYLVFHNIGFYESTREAAIGLFGGAALIHLVNYFQHSGSRLRRSAESQPKAM